jgi:transcriptional regulator GlxA family with amidase domain
VEEDFGNELALEVARELVVYLKRSGGQLQYSQPLLLQTRAKQRFGDIAAWIRGHLDEELTVEALAERAHLSPRHFNRKFKDVFGLTPGDFVEEIRLDEARWLLANGGDAVERVATDVGYSSGDTFRRAFERRFGVGPLEYRRRFGTASA